MAEVFTIDGAPLGVYRGFGNFGAASCPPGWAVKGNSCSAPRGAASPVGASLQRAVAALGKAVGDRVLASVKADGIVGPGTAAAVNRALVTYATNAPPALRTGRLTVFDVAKNASSLTSTISAASAGRGGKPVAPPAPVAKKTVTAVRPAIPPKVASAAASTPSACPAGWRTTPRGYCAGPAAMQLQAALRSAGQRITPDGVIGPGTAAAVRAVTGRNLTPAQVAQNAVALTAEVQAKSGKRVTATVPKMPTAPRTSAPRTASVRGTPIRKLQTAVRALGRAVDDRLLQLIAVDGILGPDTTNKVNLAMSKYVSANNALPIYRTGHLTQAQIGQFADTLASTITSEIMRRGAATPGDKLVVQAFEAGKKDVPFHEEGRVPEEIIQNPNLVKGDTARPTEAYQPEAQQQVAQTQIQQQTYAPAPQAQASFPSSGGGGGGGGEDYSSGGGGGGAAAAPEAAAPAPAPEAPGDVPGIPAKTGMSTGAKVGLALLTVGVVGAIAAVAMNKKKHGAHGDGPIAGALADGHSLRCHLE
jgi:lysozyme family protein